MKLPEKGLLLRIFIGESDRSEGHPLYEAIVNEARRLNMAGAAVLKGVMGFGANSRIHTTRVPRLSEDLPMIIEIADRKERINLLMPYLNAHFKEGLITLEEVRVIKYRHNKSD
jgi:PII-like signaling protein